MMWSPPAHSLTEHSNGRVAQFDAHAHGGDPRCTRADDELVTMDRLETLAAYSRAWALPDEGSIRAELARCWTAHSTHVNSFTDTIHGFDGLTHLILDLPAMFPGATFRVTSVPDLHHDVARFAWRLQSTNRIRILGRDFGYSVEGLNYVEFDQVNRIRRVVVFFGPLVHLPQAQTEFPAQPAAIGITRPGTDPKGRSRSVPLPTGPADEPAADEARLPGS